MAIFASQNDFKLGPPPSWWTSPFIRSQEVIRLIIEITTSQFVDQLIGNGNKFEIEMCDQPVCIDMPFRSLHSDDLIGRFHYLKRIA